MDLDLWIEILFDIKFRLIFDFFEIYPQFPGILTDVATSAINLVSPEENSRCKKV